MFSLSWDSNFYLSVIYYFVDVLVTNVTRAKAIFTLYSSGIPVPREFLVHGKPATAIETVILTVC